MSGGEVFAVGVCGFPRSGSSMTMRMLHAGGLLPVRGSSPGSYELPEGLGPLAEAPAVMFVGRAVKLLDYGQWFSRLPQVEWRFIWLDRDPTEQAKSNLKFMALVAPNITPVADRNTVRRLASSYRADRPRVLAWYRERGEVLVSSFESILADPTSEARRFADFLPGLDAITAASVPLTRSSDCAPDLSFELSMIRTTDDGAPAVVSENQT